MFFEEVIRLVVEIFINVRVRKSKIFRLVFWTLFAIIILLAFLIN